VAHSKDLNQGCKPTGSTFHNIHCDTQNLRDMFQSSGSQLAGAKSMLLTNSLGPRVKSTPAQNIPSEPITQRDEARHATKTLLPPGETSSK
jgi:hypothetical protein